MKLVANILLVQDCSDHLKIRAQGRAKAGADWRPWLVLELEVPTRGQNKQFYVGRPFEIEMKLK